MSFPDLIKFLFDINQVQNLLANSRLPFCALLEKISLSVPERRGCKDVFWGIWELMSSLLLASFDLKCLILSCAKDRLKAMVCNSSPRVVRRRAIIILLTAKEKKSGYKEKCFTTNVKNKISIFLPKKNSFFLFTMLEYSVKCKVLEGDKELLPLLSKVQE